MNLDDKINKIENKIDKVGDNKQSLAYEMLKEQRKQNKRLFAVIIVLCLMLTGITCYTIWLLNDIQVIETTETYDMSTEDGNNNYVGGDNNGEITNN